MEELAFPLNDIPLNFLLISLIALLAVSAFFSGAETALMTLNRYRLLHQVKVGRRGALRAQKLLHRPDLLTSLILLGKNFANALAASVTTLITLRVWDENGIAIAAGLLTLALLVLTEDIPKTLGTERPNGIAFAAGWLMLPLMRLLYPVIWSVNSVSELLIKLLGLKTRRQSRTVPGKEELRTIVAEAGAMIPERYQNMLLSVLDLESATAEDIMVPRNEIVGLDLDDSLEEIMEQIRTSRHTRLPVYRKSIDKVFGMLHLRKVLLQMSQGNFTKEALAKSADRMYFIPENMPLHQLLLSFKRENVRFGLLIDEYGDVLGLVTLEDLLQEIVGEFTNTALDVRQQKDGGYLVDASITVRELNRVTGWSLPTEGPKTLNGLIIEYLETIPIPGTSLKMLDHRIEIIQVDGNAIKQVLFHPCR